MSNCQYSGYTFHIANVNSVLWHFATLEEDQHASSSTPWRHLDMHLGCNSLESTQMGYVQETKSKLDVLAPRWPRVSLTKYLSILHIDIIVTQLIMFWVEKRKKKE